MLQSKQRLLQLNAKLAETLTDKGLTATADETTTSLVNKVADITSGDDTFLRELINGSVTELIVPDGIKNIPLKHISYKSFTSVYFPDSVTKYDTYLFYTSKIIKTVKLSSNADISEAMFKSCTSIEEIYVPEGVTTINRYAFNDCTALKTVYLPSTITTIGYMYWTNIFENDTNLEFLTLGNGFNANNLNVSWSEKFSRETIVNCFNAFADRTGLTAYTFTINKVVGDKLTDEDRAIATTKNWTIVEKEV